MIYLYAGLAASLVIPLMALAEALISAPGLDGSLINQRALQLQMQEDALAVFEADLATAMTAGLLKGGASKRMEYCSKLGKSPSPNGFLVDWDPSSLTPECTVFLSKQLSSSDDRVLRLELEYIPSIDPVLAGLPEFGNTKPYTGLDLSLRINKSCWVASPSLTSPCI